MKKKYSFLGFKLTFESPYVPRVEVVRCKDCFFWGIQTNKLRACHNPKIVKGYKWDEKDISDNAMVVENDEGWGFRTGPEFGCVLGKCK